MLQAYLNNGIYPLYCACDMSLFNIILTIVFSVSQICYFFYKNITFGFTLFLYEAYTTFSSTPAYNDWFLSLYNVFFSSLPVIALGVFDQDVSARYCLKVSLFFSLQSCQTSCNQTLSWFHSFHYYTKKVCRTCSSVGEGYLDGCSTDSTAQ